MFNYYRDAAVCYAYMSDVFDHKDSLSGNAQYTSNQIRSLESDFSRSRWFTRGWTLQELLAPSLLVFYAADWQPLGTRDDLRKTVAIVTKIDHNFFVYGKFSDYSIAQKFSWASGRKTSRIEDEAYCLLGLFGVSIPLLYGEGRRAFRRLQEELMRVSDDQSIFAWSSADEIAHNQPHPTYRGLLASSPAAFGASGHIIRGKSDYSSPPYSITNKGISIHLPLIEPDTGYAIPYGVTHGGRSQVSIALTPTGTLAILNCQSSKGITAQLAIVIEQTDDRTRYFRTNSSLGLLSIPLADMKANASHKVVLIQAHDEDRDGIGWTNQKDGQLVILAGLPRGVILKSSSSGIVCYCFGNGTISLRMPSGESPVNLDIEYEHSGFSVIITPPTWKDSKKTLTAKVKANWSNLMLTSGSERMDMDATNRSVDALLESRASESEATDAALSLSTKQLDHAFKLIMPEWSFLVEHFRAELQRAQSEAACKESDGTVTKEGDGL